MSDKLRAVELLQSTGDEIIALGRQLFATPELGFKETQTLKAITHWLKDAGIPYRTGLTLTGIQATLGTGGYHIALMADMDAIAVSNQGVSTPFHSCGHSIQVAVLLGVLKALHLGGFAQKHGCRVSFIGAPAEEYIDLEYRQALVQQGKLRYLSGKQNMIADGLFDDIDCVLTCHIMGDENAKFDIGSTLAGFSVKKVTFTGKAAHSGVVPHLGVNALHAASLCLSATAFLTEQFAPEDGLQLHPILTSGGISMNAIPDTAVLQTYLRANTNSALFTAQEKFDNAATHCAAALGAGCSIQNTQGYMPLVQSAPLTQIVYQNMLALCSDADILKNVVSGASGDIGDVAFLLPAIQFGFSGITGRVHSAQFEISDEAHAYIDTATVMLGTVLDLLEVPALRVTNPNYAQYKKFYLQNWLRQK